MFKKLASTLSRVGQFPWLKKFIYFSGVMSILGWLVIGALLIQLAVSFYQSTSVPKGQSLVDASIKDEIYDLMLTQTATVYDAHGRFIARAYQSADGQTVITNLHVLEALCRNDFCNNLEFNIKGEQEFFRSERAFVVQDCSAYLDICILRASREKGSEKVGDKAIPPAQLSTATIKAGEKVYAVPPITLTGTDSTNRVLVGTVKRTLYGRLEIDFRSRKGFSGSPLFNGKGEYVGSIAAMDLSQAGRIGLINQLVSLFVTSSFYTEHTEGAPASAIALLAERRAGSPAARSMFLTMIANELGTLEKSEKANLSFLDRLKICGRLSSLGADIAFGLDQSIIEKMAHPYSRFLRDSTRLNQEPALLTALSNCVYELLPLGGISREIPEQPYVSMAEELPALELVQSFYAQYHW